MGCCFRSASCQSSGPIRTRMPGNPAIVMAMASVLFLRWIIPQRALDSQDLVPTHKGEILLCSWGWGCPLQGQRLWWKVGLPGRMFPTLSSVQAASLQWTLREKQWGASSEWGRMRRPGKEGSVLSDEQGATVVREMSCSQNHSFHRMLDHLYSFSWILPLGQQERVLLSLTDTSGSATWQAGHSSSLSCLWKLDWNT